MQRRLTVFFLNILILGMLPLKLSAADLTVLDSIGTNVASYAVIRSEFTQTKTMLALKRPLVTQGDIVFSRHHGVLWQISAPYQMRYILNENSIVEIDPNGLRQTRDIKSVPGLAQISRILRAILSVNMASLQEHFTIVAEGDASQWEMSLSPKQHQLAQSLSSVTISGGAFVETIKINETSETVTALQFANTEGATVLSDVESQLLGISVTP